MRMIKKMQPELVASKDKTRPSLNQVYLDVENKCAVATDGAMLVKIPVDIDHGDTTGGVPVSAMKAARSEAGRGDVCMSVNGACMFPSGASIPRPDMGKFPAYEQVIPAVEGELRIGLNAALLATLAKAMGPEGVVLTINVADLSGPIVVRPNGGPGPTAMGVLMPMRF